MNKKNFLIITSCLTVGVIGIVCAISFGAKNIPISTILESIFKYREELDMQIVIYERMPRAICAYIIGGLLALSGAVMQGITRNPLAEPSMMGITQGATLSVSLLGGTIFTGLFANTLAALVGSFISGILIFMLSLKNARNLSVSKLLLAGNALGVFFISMASIVALLQNKSQELAFWVAGGLKNSAWHNVAILLVIGGVSTAILILLSGKFNIMALGEDVAIGLGVNTFKLRVYSVILIIVICAICVSTAGNIAFVGLIVPHIVKKIFGGDFRLILPISFLFGGTLLIWADVVARLINQPYETPIGLFTALIGVPIFIFLVRNVREIR